MPKITAGSVQEYQIVAIDSAEQVVKLRRTWRTLHAYCLQKFTLRTQSVVYALLVTTLLAACGSANDADNVVTPLPEPEFTGSASCAGCHVEQHARWRDSHHDLAMEMATADTVVGDFDDVTYRYFDEESRFFMRDGRFWVNTANEQGEAQDFEVAYTFGVEPLQQYLIEFSGGRLQPLSIAWDTRSAEAGGQRWFHLYPDENITHDDPLHWTGANQNWNYMCAECHSTDLIKNFDRGSRTYDTAWAEIEVGCEGCHGPASQHVALREAGDETRGTGLSVNLNDAGSATWKMNTVTGIAERSQLRMRSPQQPDACGRCHSRRSQLSDGYEYGKPLLDTHMPALLDDGLYFADGQIRDEVYVWGSFLQSKMYQSGVSCTDCHDPHSATLKTGGEISNVCATCHLPATFATREHHQHRADQVACVDCHMPSRDYMVVDGRRDHSFRIPRPDLSVSTGSPNACENCHADQGAEWADAILRNWYGSDRPGHYARAIHAGRSRSINANTLLAQAATNSEFPGIARATALTLLAWPLDATSADAIQQGLQSADGLIRFGALRALTNAPPQIRLEWATPLLEDPLLTVRLGATGVLLPLRNDIAANFQATFAEAENEYLATQLANAERPEAYSNLAGMFLSRGDTPRAERAYQTSLQIEPRTVTARVNLADMYRQQGRDDDAKVLLKEGIELDPANAALRHTLGLLHVRQQELNAGLSELEHAADLDSGNSRYIYVYAVALNSLGRSDEAIAILSEARTTFAADFDIGWALVTMLRDAGQTDAARAAAASLRQQFPANPDVASLLETISEQNLAVP